MSLIAASNLSKSFGPVDLFSGLSFAVPKGARLAIVGPNGIGKTTLLRILVGEDEPSSGTVTRARGVRIGYLPQEADFEMAGTVWESCVDVFADLIRQGDELARLEHQMADPAGAESVLQKYGALQDDFERKGGYIYQTRIRQVLTGLGFTEEDFHLALDHLSGGQRTRAYLAKLLLSNPDLLLLDEPTNHLDIAAVEWLEGYLNQWEGAAVIVSHDRYLLDRVANGILEMTAAGVEIYRGNYSAYVAQRQERWERRLEVFDREKEKLLKDVEYIKKNIAGQNVSQAKGKLRRLTRVVQAVEQVGMDAVLATNWSRLEVETTTSPFSVDEAERRVRALRLPDHRPPHFHIHLRAEKRSGELVLRTRDLQIGFPDRALFTAPDIELRRTECAALIGPNGAGKSTFLKTILGQQQPLRGEVILGASLHIGYFAQAHEGLNPGNTLIEEIQIVVPGMLPADVRHYLGRYLFSGDDAFKKIEVLSGGERGRLALAKLALQETNLLLLDEPTNHLDIPSQEILQEVLDDYPGTILLVSHDRYLVDSLATQVWEIGAQAPEALAKDPRSAAEEAETLEVLTVFKGTYSQLREELERQTLLADAHLAESTRKSGSRRASIQRSTSAQTRPNKNAAKDERRRIARLQELENSIAVLEARLAELSRALETPPSDPAEVAKLGAEYACVQKDMDVKLAEWEGLQVE
jgi:ATP-binding cassette subfamily F protein 3